MLNTEDTIADQIELDPTEEEAPQDVIEDHIESPDESSELIDEGEDPTTDTESEDEITFNPVIVIEDAELSVNDQDTRLDEEIEAIHEEAEIDGDDVLVEEELNQSENKEG